CTHPDCVFEVSHNSVLFSGLWSLTYEQELTTPLHITAGRGFTECLRHLLMWGARVDLAPGGTTALHEACEECQPECVKLLLQHGANPNATNEDSQMPLHVCQTSTSIWSALKLQNDEGNTALNAACSQPQHCASLEHYSRVCHMLVSAGADIHIKANPDVVDLLLKYKALVNEMDYGGDAPMHNILKAVAYKKNHESERIVQALLNYGSIRVWPGALPKVRNGPESFPFKYIVFTQKHREFYKSLFALMQTPRSLQHLARHRLRTFLEGHLRNVIPKLGLPTFLKNDLMLAFRDYMH
uniref:Ankyrin repeat and SOCS box containing 10 n=1 Tax=Cyprinus carpio TaxID=7962 RepID=A0A8C2DMR0_CYPCA